MGGSALPAAERVRETGHVIAVDLAQNLLDKGAKQAAERGLANIEFRRADLENLPFADQSFDAVICVFGIFFVPDFHGAVQGLWRLVRPAGVLAITIWGAKMFEPAEDKFWEGVRREDPELFKSIKPWNKIVEPEPFRALLVECGVTAPEVVAERGMHPFIRLRIGGRSFLVGAIGQPWTLCSPLHRDRVRVATVEAVGRDKIREIRADVVYAVARRPSLRG